MFARIRVLHKKKQYRKLQDGQERYSDVHRLSSEKTAGTIKKAQLVPSVTGIVYLESEIQKVTFGRDTTHRTMTM